MYCNCQCKKPKLVFDDFNNNKKKIQMHREHNKLYKKQCFDCSVSAEWDQEKLLH